MAEVKAQFGAGVRGAADTATFGLADKAAAAVHAYETGGLGGDFIGRFHEGEAIERASDAYDREHYGVARGLGQTAGFAGSLLLTGGIGAGLRAGSTAVKAVPIARAITRTAGTHGAVMGAGATASTASQLAVDAAPALGGRRPAFSSPETYASTAIGGALGGLATLYRGPQTGAATEAFATEASHAALTGQPMSFEKIQTDATIGRWAGANTELLGTHWAKNRPSFKWQGKYSKDYLGDKMGEIHSFLRGEPIVAKQKYFPVSGGNTRVDGVYQSPSDGVWLREFKFGEHAGLSKRQREAQAEYGDRYEVFHYLPSDFGRAVGGVAGLSVTQAVSPEDR